MKKKDPSVTYLNKWGYNVVKLPRAGIEPLDVVGKDQSAQWLGPISTIWTSANPTPQPAPPKPATMINGQKTDALDVSLGLSVLSNALAAFGATTPSLDVAYKQARQVQFSFADVKVTEIAPFAAGDYLTGGSLKSDNPVVKRYFQDPKCSAYLITAVLKSDSITVSATDEHGTEVSLDVPALSGLVGAKVAVKPSNSSKSTVTFTGPEPITFGFALQQIEYDGQSWSLRDAPAAGQNAFGVSGESFSPHMGPGPGPHSVVLDTKADDCCLDLQYEELHSIAK